MADKVPPPLFTLRGHNVGVTALAHCHDSDNQSYLVSGDEGGNIIVWDLFIFKKLITFPGVVNSRIQSLRIVKLIVESSEHNILIIQSRDHGLKLVDLGNSILYNNQPKAEPKIIASYPTFESIFSRGDSLSITNDGKALLAYPSCLENYLVTVRLIGLNGVTEQSGSASRGDEGKNPTIFDIVIKGSTRGSYLLFVAYEDGYICTFSFSLSSTKTVPLLNYTGLKIDLIKKINSNIGDFISAFDIMISGHETDNNIIAVCGSPLKKLTFLVSSLNHSPPNSGGPILDEVALKRQGVSALAIRPDNRLVAVAGWDSIVRLYSMKSRKLLACLNYHLKQVQDILFIERHSYSNNDHLSAQAKSSESQTTKECGKYLMCCASMEGTISLSVIY